MVHGYRGLNTRATVEERGMAKSKACESCGLPQYAKQVRINEDGLCSCCSFDRTNTLGLRDFERNRALFQKRIDAVKGKYEYDAIVGVSGGKDGAYVLHRLVKDYKLKVLAFTYDNAFISDVGRQYAEKLALLYGVDWIFYEPKNLKPMYRGIIKLTGIPCNVCSLGGYGIGLKLALDKRVPLIVHGRSPHQMHRIMDEVSLRSNISVKYLLTNLEEPTPGQLIEQYRASYDFISLLVGKMKITRKEKRLIMAEFFDVVLTITEGFVPESFGFFLTERYDETAIRRELAEAGYESPPTHADCLIHNAAGYLTTMQEGVPYDVREAAVMRRWGEMDKDEFEALLKLRRGELESPTPEIESELRYLCEALEISPKHIKKPTPVLVRKFVEKIREIQAKK